MTASFGPRFSTGGPNVWLTARQMEILWLVTEGLTNREIAETMAISRRTVEVHRFQMMQRLRVHNVAQLCRRAVELRLLSKAMRSRMRRLRA
jgi:two-component system nitrate/nitrite response regulator NarL